MAALVYPDVTASIDVPEAAQVIACAEDSDDGTCGNLPEDAPTSRAGCTLWTCIPRDPATCVIDAC